MIEEPVADPAADPMADDGNAQVRAVYDLTRSAVKARQEMNDAVQRGLAQQYHRVLRERPEALLADALIAVRRQLGDMAAERRSVGDNSLQVEQLNEAMGQVAGGTMLWVTDFFGGKGGKP